MLGNVKAFILSICWRSGVRHPAGLGEHHGHVDSRAHPRSGGVEDAWLYAQTVLGLYVGEAMTVRCCLALVRRHLRDRWWRISWALALPRPAVFARGACKSSQQRCLCPGSWQRGGIHQRDCPFLPRVAIEYCGGLAPHRLIALASGRLSRGRLALDVAAGRRQDSRRTAALPRDKLWRSPSATTFATETTQGPDDHDRAGHRADRHHGGLHHGAAGRTGQGVQEPAAIRLNVLVSAQGIDQRTDRPASSKRTFKR